MKPYACLTLLFFFFISCKGKYENKDHVTYEKIKGQIIFKSYDNEGKLLSIKFFNLDTVAKGQEAYYYPNGKIKKWLWFQTEYQYPVAGFYYDSSGRCDSMRGNPFIAAIRTKPNNISIEMVAPPNTKFKLGYRDFMDSNIIRQEAYEPFLTDSTSWVTLTDFKFENGHKYYMYFYVIDDNNKIIDSIYQELTP